VVDGALDFETEGPRFESPTVAIQFFTVVSKIKQGSKETLAIYIIYTSDMAT
jgi:hypothetical protein